MRGLSKGEASTALCPRVQLFSRYAESLIDIYSGTYRVEDIHDPAAGATVKVATTPINTTDVTIGGQCLGAGRYYIPISNTSTWNVGTHRAVCTYKQSLTGPTFTQVIEFEVLDPIDWPDGGAYRGYAATRRLISDGFYSASRGLPALHRAVDRYSRDIERWTGRSFEPRYLSYAFEGAPDGPLLFVPEAIIAVDRVELINKSTDGDDAESYISESYRVYNRHMDGMLSEDDRFDPKIARVDYGAWEDFWQSIRVTGLFGFTSPGSLEECNNRVGTGSTPQDLTQVIGALASRYFSDPKLLDPTVQMAGAITSARTRDQSVTLGGATTRAGDGYSWSGDGLIDQILAKYHSPVAMHFASRRYSVQEAETTAIRTGWKAWPP